MKSTVIACLILLALPGALPAEGKDITSPVMLGRQLALANKHQEAIEQFTRAIEENRDPGQAYLGRASSELALGNIPDAINDCDAAIGVFPGYAEAYLTRGMAFAANGQDKAALADYGQSILLAPRSPYAYYNRGVLYSRAGEHEKAKKDFEAAIEADPKLAPAYLGEGLSLYALGANAEAVAAYSKCVELSPDYTDAYNNRGLAYKKLGQYAQAAADFSRVLARDPRDATTLVNRGHAFRKEGKYKEALADFTEALRQDPGLWIAYNGYAWLLATCPDPSFLLGKKAVDLAETAVSLNKSSFTLDTLAAALARAGRFGDARRTQERAIEYREKIEGRKAPAEFVLRLESYKAQQPWTEE